MASFLTVNLYARGGEVSSTIDPEGVKAVFDDPDFTFDCFGWGKKLGGREFYGVALATAMPLALSVIHDGQIEQLDLFLGEFPNWNWRRTSIFLYVP